MGGPVILKKKWGDLLHLGGPGVNLVNLGGPKRSSLKKSDDPNNLLLKISLSLTKCAQVFIM